MSRPSETFTVRIPSLLLERVKKVAVRLDLTVNALLLNSLLWAQAPRHGRSWLDHALDLRRLLGNRDPAKSIILLRWKPGESDENAAICERLQDVGLIDGFTLEPVPEDAVHMAAFELTPAGRLIIATSETPTFEERVAEAARAEHAPALSPR